MSAVAELPWLIAQVEGEMGHKGELGQMLTAHQRQMLLMRKMRRQNGIAFKHLTFHARRTGED
jgi:hypothetical protein